MVIVFIIIIIIFEFMFENMFNIAFDGIILLFGKNTFNVRNLIEIKY